MKNINVNTVTFNTINSQPLSFKPFSEIEAVVENGTLIIRDFNVLILINVVLSSKQEDSLSCVVKDEEYDVMVRLNHIQTNEGFIIFQDSFRLDDNTIKNLCKPIMEDKRIVSIPKLALPKGAGKYGIKVFVKNSKDKKWFVQSIHTFYVTNKQGA